MCRTEWSTQCATVTETTSQPTTVAEPLFRRPTRGDALALAREHFLAGERVDMQVLAAELNVGRTTLYRWVGDREQLLGEMLSELANELLAMSAAQASGTGLDRFLASIRSYLELCIGSASFQTFLHREPEIALRLVMSAEARCSGTPRKAWPSCSIRPCRTPGARTATTSPSSSCKSVPLSSQPPTPWATRPTSTAPWK